MRTLVVDDDETLRLSIRLALESEGYTVAEACDGVEALEKVHEGGFEAAILDVNMPRMNGLELLQHLKNIDPQIFCLILTAHSDVKDAVTAIKCGAFDYVEKPVETDRLLEILKAAKEASALVEAMVFSAPQVQFAEGRTIIGGSSEIKRVFDVIYKLARVETSVLVRGESGTGKELVARALHFNSQRKKGPFVAVNCAAIPENLIESELFGHEKGSFTGADRKKVGKFQIAEGGTIFLDEIGDISQAMQVKLLRVLQEKTFCPVGGNQEMTADVRIIAATNRPLEKMIEQGNFRSDLFYRLNVLPIMLPPLRERRDDIAPLVEYMIKKFNHSHGRSIKKIDKAAHNALRMYNWPGNIRELENVIEHAFILEPSDAITMASLPEYITGVATSKRDGNGEAETHEILPGDWSDLNYPALKERFERDFLIKALKAFDGRVNQTALHTKMTKVTLLRKLEKYGINPKEYYRHQSNQ